MNYNIYSAYTNRTLFPPVVPNSIPAFDGKKMYQIFFKKSAANFVTSGGQGGDFKHIQISIRRVSNNSNALDTSKHITGYVIVPLSEESIDDPGFEPSPGNVYRVYSRDDKTPYCVFLDGLEGLKPTFGELNTLYKVQIRLGVEEYNKNWKVSDIQRMNTEGKVSEWSTVLTMKPIDAPSFGVQSFISVDEDPDKKGNTIATANFEYVGYYDSTFIKNNEQGVPIVSTVNEKLSEYWFKLLNASGKVLAESGPIVTIEHDRPNLSYVFNYLTQDMTNYFVIFGVRTENGYVGEKKYLVKADYKVLQMSNAMVRVSNERDQARMRIDVQAKQVVLEPIIKKGTEKDISKLGFIRDESDPQFKDLGIIDQSKHPTTHAVIEGSVASSKSFYLSCPNDTWVLEAKLSGLKSFKTREEALLNPYIMLENDYSLEKDVVYATRVSIICYETKEFSFDVNPDPTKIIIENGVKKFPKNTTTPKTIYYIEAIKTSFKKENGREIEIASQRTRTRSAKKTNYGQQKELTKQSYNVYPKKPSLNEYVYAEGRHTLKSVPAAKLLDIKYFNSSNPNAPQVVSTSLAARKSLGANDSIPFNPKQEYYIYLSNNLGSLTFTVFDNGYITTSEKMNAYLDSKIVTPEMEVEQLDKFKIEKERA